MIKLKHSHSTSLSQLHVKWAYFFKVKELLNLADCKTFKPVHFNEVKRESESDYEPHVHQKSNKATVCCHLWHHIVTSRKFLAFINFINIIIFLNTKVIFLLFHLHHRILFCISHAKVTIIVSKIKETTSNLNWKKITLKFWTEPDETRSNMKRLVRKTLSQRLISWTVTMWFLKHIMLLRINLSALHTEW
jgi:hypothetical protein